MDQENNVVIMLNIVKEENVEHIEFQLHVNGLDQLFQKDHIEDVQLEDINHHVQEEDVVQFLQNVLEEVAIKKENVDGQDLQHVIISKTIVHGEIKMNKLNKKDVVIQLINVLVNNVK